MNYRQMTFIFYLFSTDGCCGGKFSIAKGSWEYNVLEIPSRERERMRTRDAARAPDAGSRRYNRTWQGWWLLF